MGTTPRGITFEEHDGSPIIDGNRQGASATRKFVLAWADVENFLLEVFGVQVQIGTTVRAENPVPFPGNNDRLLPDAYSVEPHAGAAQGSGVTTLSSGTNTFTQALVTVKYKEQIDSGAFGLGGGGSVSITVPEHTYLTYETDDGAEYLSTQGRAWKWDTVPLNEVPYDIGINVLVPTTMHKLTWHNAIRPPVTAIKQLRGLVNSAEFAGFAAETLLFVGAQRQRTFAPSNSNAVLKNTLWNMAYTFAERLVRDTGGSPAGGHNHFFNPELGYWQKVKAKAAPNDPPYTGGDFSALFEYEPE